ncbi:fibronectin type III domain-containing protein [Paenibacillus sp. YYML68]|uniref:fibronectin type III domain-containing protein n=1 Tax=Paenibacillus sp. YYML68 TaxID=2909250 RepID=UPI002490BDB4|nr:fibronectin type III domain-containing protein [Paenibacillus sp. YYML68]
MRKTAFTFIFTMILFMLSISAALASNTSITLSTNANNGVSQNLFTASHKVQFNKDISISSIDYFQGYNYNATNTFVMKIYKHSDKALLATSNSQAIPYGQTGTFTFPSSVVLKSDELYIVAIVGKGIALHSATLPQYYTSTDGTAEVQVLGFEWASGEVTPGNPAHTGYVLPITLHVSPVSQAPSAPSNLTATADQQKVDLAWTESPNALAYNVKRSTTAGGPYTVIASNVTGTTYSDTAVSNGTTYYYVVSAVNADGESGNSNEAEAAPLAPVIKNRALLVITLVSGLQKEYDLSMTEANQFIAWYNDRADGAGQEVYTISKNYNRASFLSRKDYIAFNKIEMFEINEYQVNP